MFINAPYCEVLLRLLFLSVYHYIMSLLSLIVTQNTYLIIRTGRLRWV